METIITQIREFKFGKLILQDPNPQMSPQQVKEHYTLVHAELLNAGIGSPVVSGNVIAIEFIANYGRKG